MRILYFNMSDALGGLELTSELYFRQLAKRNFDIRFFLKRETPLHQRLREFGERVIFDTHEGKLSVPLIRKLRRVLQDLDIDILHVHRSIDIWTASLAVRGLRSRLVYTSHNFLEKTNKRDPLHRFVYRRCDVITVFSEPQRSGFLKCLPVAPAKVKVIPNGVDFARFNPASIDVAAARRSFGLAAEHLVVGVVGRITPGKGQWMLVEVAPALLEKFPNLRILLVGADTGGRPDAYLSSLRRRVSEMGLDGHIIFTGFRSDVPQCLAAMDVFVLPSYVENFGTVLLEAMAMGRACLGSNSQGTPDILEGGRAGVLFQPESPASLKEALLPILADKERRSFLGAGSRSCGKAVPARTYHLDMD